MFIIIVCSDRIANQEWDKWMERKEKNTRSRHPGRTGRLHWPEPGACSLAFWKAGRFGFACQVRGLILMDPTRPGAGRGGANLWCQHRLLEHFGGTLGRLLSPWEDLEFSFSWQRKPHLKCSDLGLVMTEGKGQSVAVTVPSPGEYKMS